MKKGNSLSELREEEKIEINKKRKKAFLGRESAESACCVHPLFLSINLPFLGNGGWLMGKGHFHRLKNKLEIEAKISSSLIGQGQQRKESPPAAALASAFLGLFRASPISQISPADD
jgi:hypothetical protein